MAFTFYKIMNSLIALLVVIFWGIWGFLFKVGITKIGIWRALLWSGIGYLSFEVGIITYLLYKGTPLTFDRGSLLITLGCVFSVVGSILFLLLLEKERASLAVPLTALYPAVTVMLGILLLKESIKFENAVGIILAIIAGILLAK